MPQVVSGQGIGVSLPFGATADENFPVMQEFLLVVPVLLFSMVAHEVAHGYAALQQGDDTAYLLGRLTFNPLKHIDPWLTILMPMIIWYGSGGQFLFGGAKPVPVNPRKYRRYRRGDLIVSSAGIVTNFALFIAFVILTVVIGMVGQALPNAVAGLAVLQRMMIWGIWLNLLLAFFNLIPIPPLDGSHLFYHLLPPHLGAKYRELSRFGFVILLGLLFLFPWVFRLLLAPAFWLLQAALAVARPFALRPFFM